MEPIDDAVKRTTYTPPMTNADRIRRMSDQELAAFMFSMVDCISCKNKLMNNGNPLGQAKCNDTDYHAMCNGDGRKCESVCLAWLQQPAEVWNASTPSRPA